MDLNQLDLRLRAIEKKLKNFEVYVRSPGFRAGRLILAALILLGAGLGASYAGYHYLKLSKQRVLRVDEALATEFPSYASDYCRWVFDNRPGYDDCLRDEQKAYTKFDAAWHRNQPIDALREQMIGCFNAAQNQNGMSWKLAADCAELNSGLPEDGKPPAR